MKQGKGQTQKTGLTWVLGAEEAARGLCVRAGSVAPLPATPHAGKAEPLGAGLEGKEQDTSSSFLLTLDLLGSPGNPGGKQGRSRQVQPARQDPFLP